MYSIGEFSKINRITTKTLRHYDRIGLLKPAKVDDWTGYRYYSPNQLAVIKPILFLKDLGCSLEEIGRALGHPKQITELLEKRKRELAETIATERDRLSRVEKYLEEFKGEKTMNEEITIKSLPEVTAASMRTVIPGYDTYFDIVPKMGEYMKSVGAVCREPACIDHKGPYSRMGDSYNRVFQWIEEKGYEVVDHPRESYIDGIWNKEDPEEWLTEIQVPVMKK